MDRWTPAMSVSIAVTLSVVGVAVPAAAELPPGSDAPNMPQVTQFLQQGGQTLTQPPPLGDATATVETEPVLTSGDAADDPAVWVHPDSPERSVVIGNDKGGALEVYDLDGSRIQRIAEGFFGNVDVRSNVSLGASTIDVIAVYRAGLRLYTIDPETRQLVNITDDESGSIPVPSGGEGLCLYHSQTSGLHAYVISRGGNVAHYHLDDADEDGFVDAERVRLWSLGSEAEGCVADDDRALFYVAEEDVAIWRYGAEPQDPTDPASRFMVDRTTADGGRLLADIEGLAIVDQPDGSGYLLASAQAGSDTDSFFAVYEREDQNAYVRSFRVVDGAQADGCGRTDGIETTAAGLGPAFPNGLFICQDNTNTDPAPSGNQNFKLVPLERVVVLGPTEPPALQPPTAVLADPVCDGLTCAFDGSASSDPDGVIVGYAWDFGDDTTSDQATPTHTYPAGGSYTVTLTVTDDDAQTDTAQTDLTVPVPAPSQIEFRAANQALANWTTLAVPIPDQVQPDDLLLLFVTGNRTDVSITLDDPGWQILDQAADETMQTILWATVADTSDPGSTPTIRSSATTKLDAQLLAYAGTDPANPVDQTVVDTEAGTSATHTTPIVPAAPPGAWEVAYWADKTSTATGWTLIDPLTERAQSIGTGGGRITSLTADSNGPTTTTPLGGRTAQSTIGNKATMWTLILQPDPT